MSTAFLPKEVTRTRRNKTARKRLIALKSKIARSKKTVKRKLIAKRKPNALRSKIAKNKKIARRKLNAKNLALRNNLFHTLTIRLV